MEEQELREKAKAELCSCTECELGPMQSADELPLEPSGWTMFMFADCKRCGRLHAIPKDNAILFIDKGPFKLVKQFYTDYVHKVINIRKYVVNGESPVSGEIFVLIVVILAMIALLTFTK